MSLDRRVQYLIRFLSYLGPGFFVTVGFIDPGNWATNVAAGSEFNYDLLWVVTLSTVILILWQHMSAHLGIVTGRCLSEATRKHTSPTAAAIYGSTAMAACIATALAEILGAALGLYLLLHIPIHLGVVIVTVLVSAALWFQRYQSLEKVVVGFVAVIGLCYLIELYLVKPDWGDAAVHAVVPTLNSRSILVAMGVLGAVIMPHNMYLHSEIIQNRQWTGKSEVETRRLLRYEFMDTLLSMLVGMLINMAMVIVAAAVFYRNGVHVTDLLQAARTLDPLAGRLADVVFGIGLVFAGVSSSLTAGIAGGTTFSGYLESDGHVGSRFFRPGMLITLVTACLLIFLIHDTFRALIVSQVALSIQLPFTMLPLYLITSDRRIMGKFANGWLEKYAMLVTGLIILGLNALLIYHSLL